jgi:predicted aldo/keto reductase-like oxidoreductase
VKKFGSTDLNVSAIGMGTIQITRLDWEQSIRVVREVMDLGVNWFDTARGYFDSELRLGEAFKGIRDRVIIISKSDQTEPAELAREIDESLHRLQTDYLDVFLFHGGDAIEQKCFLGPGGLLDTAEKAAAAGKIRYLGISAHRPAIALKALDFEVLRVALVPANFISREYIDGPFMRMARQKQVAILAMKPFGGGRITDSALCLRFLRQYPDLFPCIGIEKSDEMEENIADWEKGADLTAEDRREIRRTTKLLGDRFCRECGYCLPCPEGIPIPTVTFMKVYSMQMPREKVVTEEHDQAIKLARNCTECRQCVERCPYNLDIPEMLKDNISFYENFSAAG